MKKLFFIFAFIFFFLPAISSAITTDNLEHPFETTPSVDSPVSSSDLSFFVCTFASSTELLPDTWTCNYSNLTLEYLNSKQQIDLILWSVIIFILMGILITNIYKTK